ncbi:MAG: alpha/beta fold hydrolase [Actinomycetes bacterium]
MTDPAGRAPGPDDAPPAPPAPAWFRDALAQQPREDTVEVEGCAIRTRAWGVPGAPGIMLVHGGAAHARWWDFLAPLLADRHHVVALDLSGHGDSGRREAYPPLTWAAEVRAVAAANGMHRPVVVGHSMGGFVAIVCAATFGDELAGAVVVDSPVRRPDPEREEARRRGSMFRAPKTYASLAEAMDHFVLVPPQPCEHPFVLHHVARTSLHRTDAGWTWKFDPHVFGRFSPSDPVFSDYLEGVRCRVAVVHGELSGIVDDEVVGWMNERLGRNAPFVEVPQAHHHLLLDQPLAFVTAVRALLADWEHTVPRSLVAGLGPEGGTGG